jgi:hypothetical protein
MMPSANIVARQYTAPPLLLWLTHYFLKSPLQIVEIKKLTTGLELLPGSQLFYMGGN